MKAVPVYTKTDENMTEKSEIIQQLHIAVENDRTDILRAFISTIEQSMHVMIIVRGWMQKF